MALLVVAGIARGASAAPQDQAARQYAAAADLQSRGEYGSAAEAWQKFIAEHDRDERMARARHNLGVCFYQAGKYAQALTVFEKAVADDTQSDVAPSTQLHLGATQFALARSGQREMYDRAVGTLQSLLTKYDQGEHVADAWYYLAESLDAQGRRQEAAAWYAKLVEKAPNHRFAADALHALAAAREEAGDRAAAIQSYQQFLTRFPNHRLAMEARLSIGRCLVASDKAAEAEEPLRKVLESGGVTAPEATHWLAQSLVKQKRSPEALALLEPIMRRAREVAWTARFLADRADAIYAIPERRKESISLYAEIAAKHPKDTAAPRALSMAALAALEAGEYSAALEYAAKFQVAYPDHSLLPDVLQVAAESNLQLGKLAEADTYYRQLIEKHPNHAGTAFWKIRRAAILHAEKKYEDTIGSLEPLLAELRAADSVAEARYLIGASQLELKRPGDAVNSLAASLEAQPAWRQAFETSLALAEAYRQTGDATSAQAVVRRAIAAFPKSPLLDRASYRLGTYLALAGQAEAAAEVYRKVIAQWPASPVAPYALHELGCAQLNLKDPAGAEATFTQLLEKRAQDALARKARYARAMARQQQGKSAAAVVDLDAALAAWPDAKEKSDARFLLGICQAELKQYDKAAAAFRVLLTEDPKYAAREESLHQWAWALKLAGRESEALEIFAKLAAEYPNGSLATESQFNIAEIRFREKQYDVAAVAYYAVVDKAARTPLGDKAAFQLAWCYYHQGNFADAQKTFAFYVAKYRERPSAPEAAMMEAECLFKQGQAAEALAAYAKLKPSPKREHQAAMLLHAGQAAAQLARWPESIEWLDRFARELPDSPLLPEALCELGLAQQNVGKPAEALAAWQQAIAKSGSEPAARAQFLIGKIQLGQSDPKEALKSFLKVVYGYSAPKWQAEAAFEAARCFEALDQKSEAVGMYRGLIEKFPKSDKIAAAKQRLAELQGIK